MFNSLNIIILQVQPQTILVEAGDIQKGIVDLAAKYGICKLVMGATSDK